MSKFENDNNNNDVYPENFEIEDMSGRIKENIQRMTEDSKFKLDIEDTSFHDIPEFTNFTPQAQPTVPTKRQRQQRSHDLYDQNISNQRSRNVDKWAERENQFSSKSDNVRFRKKRDISEEENQNPAIAKRKNKKKQTAKNFGGVFYALSVVGVSIFLSIFLIQSLSDFFGMYKKDHTAEIKILKTDDLQAVSEKLKTNNIINQPLTFRVYGVLRKKDENFREGNFTLDADMSYDDILSRLRTTEEEYLEAKITFLEGVSVLEMADLLKEDNVSEKDKFIEAVDTREAFYEWEKEIPTNPLRAFKYEGYLFPDTYDMYINEQGSSIVRKFVSTFDQKIINTDVEKRLEKLDMTLDELIILASIIEKETSGYYEDMDKVSAIFHNRLNNPSVYPRLESDVTIFYVDWKIKPYLQAKYDTTGKAQSEYEKYYNAYSTYEVDGLPIGPICNPGEAAIRAALYPSEDMKGYYFFVTDAKSKFYYAKTFEEHKKNVAEAKLVKNDEGETKIGGTTTQE